MALTDFLLVAGFGYMGLLAGRNIALFALAAPPALTRHATTAFESWRRALGWRRRPTAVWNRKTWLNAVILAVVGVAVLAKVSIVLPRAENEAVFRESLPVDAVTYIQENRPLGNLFNSYNWGGYLLWALPEYPVFVDGRTDLYNDEIISEWVLVMRAGEGWQAVLEKYDINLILVESGSTLDRVLETEPGWQDTYRDEKAVIYSRGGP